MNDIILSIYVATYNHERYIRQALESILMQETQYSYEVLVGEDFSQDKTRAVLQEIETEYPGKFQIFYRDHNMYSEIPSNAMDLVYRCKGKYLIALEGDDFWTDKSKIEKQVTFLEEHPEYIAVAHNCCVIDENSKLKDEKYPECKDEEYFLEYFASNILPGQLTTVVYRNIYRYKILDKSLLGRGLIPGDRLLYFTLAANGRIYCMQQEMSAYRHVTNNGTSFSATYKYDFMREIKWHAALVNYAYKINNVKAEKCAELLYFSCLLYGIRKGNGNIRDAKKNLKIIKHKMRTCLLYISSYFNKLVLRKKVYVSVK